MKFFVKLSLLLCLFVQHSKAQSIENINDIQPNAAFDNIHVQKLYTDSNSTSFVIWVKKSVKPHLHAEHSETLYVISGNGSMQIGDETVEIKAGDTFTIPEKTVHSVSVLGDAPLKVLSVQSPEFLGKDRIFVE